MKVSDLFVACLENEGVTHVFGVPGEENEDLLFSLAGSSITFVPTRHESGAAFIADVHGRLTGTAGVCLATLGPGATNLVTGVADANLDKAPVVAITAQGGITRMHHESHQVVDIVQMFRPITKWNTTVSHPEITTEVVRKAFRVAELEKPGATHIELPEDIAKATVSANLQPLKRTTLRRPAPDYKALKKTIELLRGAKKPLIIAGNGAIRKLASKHLTQLADTHRIPVAATFMGKGAVSDRNEHSLFTVGLGFKDYVDQAIEQADLIMTVGYDIAEFAPERLNPDGKKKLVHIDFAPAETYAHYVPDVEVVCDISATLWELNQQLKDVAFGTAWWTPIRQQILDDIKSYDLAEGQRFTIPGTLNVVRDILDDDGLVISDVGSHKMWIARNFPTHTANGCIISNGLASMGISLPGGIAAKLVDPERQVVCIMGDGGFLMNSQEIETAKRLGLGYTILVMNDNDYGLINWKQTMSTGTSTGTKLTNPDFKKYAESFGVKGYKPRTLDELNAQLREAITSQELCVVEVPVDPSVNAALVEKLRGLA